MNFDNVPSEHCPALANGAIPTPPARSPFAAYDMRAYMNGELDLPAEVIADAVTASSNLWTRAGASYFGCEETLDALPAGAYKAGFSNQRGYYLEKIKISTDDLFIIPDNESEKIVNAIHHFWSRKAVYRKYNFLWKRGMLLWGPPGCGKTITIELLSREMTKQGGITLFVDHPGLAVGGLHLVRRVEPDRPIIVIMEDIDSIIKKHTDSELLSLLDGEVQIDNVVYIATTNYPDQLDKRITCRPSRFDEVILMDMPSPKARRMYIEQKSQGFCREHIEDIIKDTNKFSIALLKELLVSVEILEHDYATAHSRLKNMADTIPDYSRYHGNPMGFMAELK